MLTFVFIILGFVTGFSLGAYAARKSFERRLDGYIIFSRDEVDHD
jgi:uncharacterized protein YneF (UPF0154 family)